MRERLRSVLFTLCAVGTATWIAPAFAGIIPPPGPMFVVQMDASQEFVPPGSTSPGTASGMAELIQEGQTNRLSFAIVFDSTFDFTADGGGGQGGAETVTGLHFHDGARSTNSGIVFGMIGPNSDLDMDRSITPMGDGTVVSGEWDSGEGATDIDQFVAALLAAGPNDDVALYVNLHTDAFPSGAIRGQVVPEPAQAASGAAALGVLGVLASRGRRRSP